MRKRRLCRKPTDEVEEIRLQAQNQAVQEAVVLAEQATANVLSQIAASLQQLMSYVDNEAETIRKDAAQIAHLIAVKLAGRALIKTPSETVINTIEEALDSFRGEAHITISICESDFETIQEKLTEFLQQNGIESRVHFKSVATMQAGDCRLDWPSGSVGRSFDDIASAIDEILEHRWPGISAEKSNIDVQQSETIQQLEDPSTPAHEVG